MMMALRQGAHKQGVSHRARMIDVDSRARVWEQGTYEDESQ